MNTTGFTKPSQLIDNMIFSRSLPSSNIKGYNVRTPATPTVEQPTQVEELTLDPDFTPPPLALEGEAVEADEALQTAGIVESTFLPELFAVQMAISGVESAESGIVSDKASAANYANQVAFNNAINNGHGIGFQEVASNQLAASTRNVESYENFSKIATGLFGPLGGAVSASLNPENFDNDTASSSYQATTAGDSTVDAQSTEVIDTQSG
jgi:hypothetical protein